MSDGPIVLGPRHKSIPSELWGMTTDDAAHRGLSVDDLATPLLTLDRAASDHNVSRMVAWAHQASVLLAPHGKTTMAPVLWRRFLDAGAWAITVATPWQAQVALAAGISRILIANEVVDPAGLRALAQAADQGAEIYCWVDSLEGVDALDAASGDNPLRVLVEYGRPGGLTGARSVEAAARIAAEVAARRGVELWGVAGFEWTFGPDRSPDARRGVVSFLREMGDLLGSLDDDDLLPELPLVSAGGSIWFDEVARQFASWTDRARVVVRSGCVQTSDNGFFAEQSPFASSSDPLTAALTVHASVLSVPDPGVAILNAGKRDMSEDLGGPRVLDVPGASIERMNDQHAWMRFPPRTRVAVGQVVRLGVSHPCTTFDRWRLIPEVRGSEDPTIVGFVETCF